MTQVSFNQNGVLILDAISKEEDLNPPEGSYRFLINAPPEDGRCEVCGRHLSELKPFGGPGDPLVGDFSGELLLKTFRWDWPPDVEAEQAWDEAMKAWNEAGRPGDTRHDLIIWDEKGFGHIPPEGMEPTKNLSTKKPNGCFPGS